jgi:hypothetical protein
VGWLVPVPANTVHAGDGVSSGRPPPPAQPPPAADAGAVLGGTYSGAPAARDGGAGGGTCCDCESEEEARLPCCAVVLPCSRCQPEEAEEFALELSPNEDLLLGSCRVVARSWAAFVDPRSEEGESSREPRRRLEARLVRARPAPSGVEPITLFGLRPPSAPPCDGGMSNRLLRYGRAEPRQESDFCPGIEGRWTLDGGASVLDSTNASCCDSCSMTATLRRLPQSSPGGERARTRRALVRRQEGVGQAGHAPWRQSGR